MSYRKQMKAFARWPSFFSCHSRSSSIGSGSKINTSVYTSLTSLAYDLNLGFGFCVQLTEFMNQTHGFSKYSGNQTTIMF